MMLCFMCLKIIKDDMYSIENNSFQWQELDIGKKVEKHFWSLVGSHNVKSDARICLQCWQEIDHFHNFYLRIEEAHMIHGTIELSNSECKEELKTQICNIKNEEMHNDDMDYCILEPEILIDQMNTLDCSSAAAEDGTKISETLDHASLKEVVKSVLSHDREENDPLEKTENESDGKCRKRRCSKEKSLEQNSVEKDKNKTDKSLGKQRSIREENDKFIAEHFKQMNCNICELPFENFTSIHKHFSAVHQQKAYIFCCNRKFFKRRDLVDHIHCHLNPNHFKCTKCNKILSDRVRLENHNTFVHGSDEVTKKHCCDECGKSFFGLHHLSMHKVTHLSEDQKKFPCEECGKFYGSSALLHRHMQAVHLKKFVKICYICGKTLSSSTELKIHMNKHEGIPQPICDICGLCVTTERGLKRHKDSQHPVDGKKDHHCPICPKISPTLKALRKHINTMHEKGYDHKCTICQKAFKRAEVLREHMASHTGTTLYTCPWCPKTFNSNGNMHAHRKKMHHKEWEEAKLQKYSGNLKPTMANSNNC